MFVPLETNTYEMVTCDVCKVGLAGVLRHKEAELTQSKLMLRAGALLHMSIVCGWDYNSATGRIVCPLCEEKGCARR